MVTMKTPVERLVYGTIVVLGVVALGLFVVLPRLSLVTALVYQGF